jgi:hypothetical protein
MVVACMIEWVGLLRAIRPWLNVGLVARNKTVVEFETCNRARKVGE